MGLPGIAFSDCLACLHIFPSWLVAYSHAQNCRCPLCFVCVVSGACFLFSLFFSRLCGLLGCHKRCKVIEWTENVGLEIRRSKKGSQAKQIVSRKKMDGGKKGNSSMYEPERFLTPWRSRNLSSIRFIYSFAPQNLRSTRCYSQPVPRSVRCHRQ